MTVNTTPAKPATIISTVEGPQVVEITAKNAELTAAAGGLVYPTVTDAADVLAVAAVDQIEWSKVSALKVRSRPVALVVPALEVAVAEEQGETARDRKNRLARERRAAKKTQKPTLTVVA